MEKVAKTAATKETKRGNRAKTKRDNTPAISTPEANTISTLSTKEDLQKRIADAKEARDKARTELAAAKAKEKEDTKVKREAETAQRKAEKEAKANAEPVWVEQKNENGGVELVDKNKLPEQIVCVDCGSMRHVTKSQLHEVVRCKECAKRYKRRKTASKRNGRMKNYRQIVQDAMTLGLFPDDFKKQWGLNE